MPARPEPIRPAYDGAWIGGLLPALQAPVSPGWVPEVAAVASRVVVLVLDGLGWSMLQAHPGLAPTLRGMQGGPITCAAPSTTAVGLPSITLGLTPAEHGLLGYRMGLEQGVLNILRWRMDSGRPGPDAVQVQPVPAFGGRSVPAVVRAEFLGSGFTEAHLAGADLQGWQTPAVLRESLRSALAGDARVLYAYYDGVDKVAHAHGLHAPAFQAELADTDRLVAEVLGVLPADTALVVTADHGHVEVGPEQVREVAVDRRLVRRLSGESRFRSIYARANKQQQLYEACMEAHGDVAWVFTREELFDDGWLGAPGPAHHRRRIGDVVLAPFAPVGFADPATPREKDMASRHGSLTPEEMLVPLLAAPGRA